MTIYDIGCYLVIGGYMVVFAGMILVVIGLL